MPIGTSFVYVTHVHALPVKEVKRLKIAREYFIFGVGFALSVLNSKAMRRPLRVELTKVQSRFFLYASKIAKQLAK